ncbi:hypothetical protein OIU78_002445 [Salix suchowensis]|nr:hypothetical protein OIU78_002445 [Salix suchowensis]
MALLLLHHQLLLSHLEVDARSISVSGVVARQNMIYLMERKRQELFAQFVGKLCIKTLKWWWDASLSMITRSYSASETSNHHMVSGIGESAAEGAIRETWEEAHAEVEIVSPFAHLDIPLIGQTYIIFLAKLKKPHFSPGPESLECQLFSLDDIPFDSLAFSSMVVTLKLYIEDVKAGSQKFHYGTINKRPGSSPSDTHAYTLDHHLQS